MRDARCIENAGFKLSVDEKFDVSKEKQYEENQADNETETDTDCND